MTTVYRLALGLALILRVAAPVAAYRIHMKSGWDFDVDKWWQEGDSIVYERFGGTISVLKRDVLRIETNGEHVNTTTQQPGPTTRLPVPPTPTPAEINDSGKVAAQTESQAETQAIKDAAKSAEQAAAQTGEARGTGRTAGGTRGAAGSNGG